MAKTVFSKIVFFFCWFLPIFLHAKIVETDHVEDVIPYINSETWLLIDLDNTLFEGAQALGHANWFYEELGDRMAQGMTKDEAVRDAYHLWIETQAICEVKPLEESFISLILSLQKKGVTIMGLTLRQPFVAESTVQQVNSLGVFFETTAPSLETFSLPAKSPTLYLKGILFVGDYNNKKDIFPLFLSKINEQPKKIVFIDDRKKNVEELEEVLVPRGIDYVGVHYTAINASKVYTRELAEFQYKFLKKIMSNQAAQLLMEYGIDR